MIEPWMITLGATFIGQVAGTAVAVKFLSKSIDEAKESALRAHDRVDHHVGQHAEGKFA